MKKELTAFTMKGFDADLYREFKGLCGTMGIHIKEGIPRAMKDFIDKHKDK